MKFYVYAYRRLDTNTIFYVGKGKGKRAYARDNRNRYWHNIVNSIPYEVVFLATDLDEASAFEAEIKFIKQFKDLGQCEANFCPGGKGSTGLKWTNEQRRRFSESQKGREGRAKGYRWTDEQKANLSSSVRGRKHSLETRAKMSNSHSGVNNAFFGKTHSDEFKSFISAHHKQTARFAGAGNPAARSVVDLKSGKMYRTLKEAAADTEVSWITISRHCRGLVKSPRFRYGELSA